MIYLPWPDEDEKPKDEDEDEEDEEKELDKLKKEEEQLELIRPKDRLITGSADTSVKIWNLQSGECLHVRYS